MTALGALVRNSAFPVHKLLGALVLALALAGWLGHAAPSSVLLDHDAPTLALIDSADPVDRVKAPSKIASDPLSDTPDLAAPEADQHAPYALVRTIAAAAPSAEFPPIGHTPNLPRAPPVLENHA